MRAQQQPAAINWAVAALLLLGPLAACAAGAAPSPVPTVRDFDAGGLLPLTALAKLSAQAGVPMGVEWVGPGEGTPVKRQWSNASVAAIAGQILNAQRPQWAYHVSWDQGTLLLRPAAATFAGDSVLDVRIRRFEIFDKRPAEASRLLGDAIHRRLFSLPPPKAFIWTGAFSLDVPVVNLTHTFINQPAYRIMDWIAATGAAARAESFWLVEDLPNRRIGASRRWCTYTYFGEFQGGGRQPFWALLPWRSDPMNVTNPLAVQRWPCAKCPNSRSIH